MKSLQKKKSKKLNRYVIEIKNDLGGGYIYITTKEEITKVYHDAVSFGNDTLIELCGDIVNCKGDKVLITEVKWKRIR